MLPQKVLWLINARFCRQILPLPQSERGDFTDKPQAPTLQDERHDRYLCNTILVKHDVVALKWVWHIYKGKDYGESHDYVS